MRHAITSNGSSAFSLTVRPSAGAFSERSLEPSVGVASGRTTQRAVLYALTSDSVPDLPHLWLDQRGRLFSYWSAEGGMDVLPDGWAGSLDRLLVAEARAAEPPRRA